MYDLLRCKDSRTSAHQRITIQVPYAGIVNERQPHRATSLNPTNGDSIYRAAYWRYVERTGDLHHTVHIDFEIGGIQSRDHFAEGDSVGKARSGGCGTIWKTAGD